LPISLLLNKQTPRRQSTSNIRSSSFPVKFASFTSSRAELPCHVADGHRGKTQHIHIVHSMPFLFCGWKDIHETWLCVLVACACALLYGVCKNNIQGVGGWLQQDLWIPGTGAGVFYVRILVQCRIILPSAVRGLPCFLFVTASGFCALD